MNPKIQEITPLLTEIFWESGKNSEILPYRLQVEELLISHFKDQLDEIRVGYKAIMIKWKDKPIGENLQNLLHGVTDFTEQKPSNTWIIPVCYEADYSKDLDALAMAKELSREEVIHLHSNNSYQINFFGFLPGFMYLTGLSPQLAHPRKRIPDRSIPAGSVAIGADQTGIYPQTSPGGWHVIGRSPILFFDMKSSNPVWAKPGDYLKFNPISINEFERAIQHPSKPKLL